MAPNYEEKNCGDLVGLLEVGGFEKRVSASKPKRVVVKVGTSSLVSDERGALKLSSISRVCEAITDLRANGCEVVFVTSGAVGAGCQKAGVDRKDVTNLSQKQALAAIGQGALLRQYDDMFTELGCPVAQVLLTLDNLASKSQYANALSTFDELFSMGVIPIVNENDTVAIEELRFGDNDTLSAQVAVMIGADWLFLLTDVDALYTANPNKDPNAKRLEVVEDISTLSSIVETDGCGSDFGTGGMATKLTAARLASGAGCTTVICSSKKPENIQDVIDGDRNFGTCILPKKSSPPRKMFTVSPKGEVKLTVPIWQKV